MLAPRHSTRRLRCLTWLPATLYLLTTTISAQQTPISVYGMAYATVDENTLYVHGGLYLLPPGSGGTSNETSQFYSLDLTQNWDTSNPPWKELTPSPHPTRISRHSMTVSPNRQTLTIWSNYPNTAANYSISTASWTQVPLTSGLLIFGVGLHAASDPTTGAVYIPGANTLIDKQMARFSFLTGLSTLIDLPPVIVTARDAYSFAWCQPRKSFVLFMGSNSTSTPFFEYKAATGKWTLLPSFGSMTPSFRYRSCLIPAYNGTKIILFGGDSGTAPSVASISILDVVSMKWINGKDAPDARSEMACSVSGDNFIVWGGYKVDDSTNGIGVSTTPLIYNLKTGQWTENFVRIPNDNKTDGGSGTGSRSGSESGPESGSEGGTQGAGSEEIVADGGATNRAIPIGAGVAGAVIVIVAITFLAIRICRQHGIKSIEMVLPKMSTLPSLEKSSDGPLKHDFSQGGMNPQQQQQIISNSNPQFTSKNEPQYVSDRSPQVASRNDPQHILRNDPQCASRMEPQGFSYSPPSYVVSSCPKRATPSRSNLTVVPGGPQNHVHQQQHQKGRDRYTIQYNNIKSPQLNLGETPPLLSHAARAPQCTVDPTTAADDEDLLEQMSSLHAEWMRRQAIVRRQAIMRDA